MEAPLRALEAFDQAVEVVASALAEIQEQDPKALSMAAEAQIFRSFLEDVRSLDRPDRAAIGRGAAAVDGQRES